MDILYLPIIQFSQMDDFINELQNQPVDQTVRVWPSNWRSGHDYVQIVWNAITCQATTVTTNGLPRNILTLSLIIGTYQESYGKAFGPVQERRKEIIAGVTQSAQVMIEDFLLNTLPAAFRVAGGQIFTGLNGNQIQPAYWTHFDHIYTELKNAEGRV
ncbi:MAG: hypothetical protein H6661_03100 [Ardenticatenaceae bacterium]|nr:hypothetical protein [Ardenticatenaceae bacterium]